MRAYRRLITSLFCPSDGTTTPPQEKRHGQKAPSLTFFPLFFRRSVVNSELIPRELERGHVAQVKQTTYNMCVIFTRGLKVEFLRDFRQKSEGKFDNSGLRRSYRKILAKSENQEMFAGRWQGQLRAIGQA